MFGETLRSPLAVVGDLADRPLRRLRPREQSPAMRSLRCSRSTRVCSISRSTGLAGTDAGAGASGEAGAAASRSCSCSCSSSVELGVADRDQLGCSLRRGRLVVLATEDLLGALDHELVRWSGSRSASSELIRASSSDTSSAIGSALVGLGVDLDGLQVPLGRPAALLGGAVADREAVGEQDLVGGRAQVRAEMAGRRVLEDRPRQLLERDRGLGRGDDPRARAPARRSRARARGRRRGRRPP